MLLYVSVVIVLLLASYCVYYSYQRREKLTCMAGMMIAMTTGMMTSISLGVVLGLYLNHDLTYSTILSVFVGMVAGYLTGKPVSLMAAMDGLMAGIMGGMMGAMLGVMLLPSNSNIMVLFVDILFVVVMLLLLKLIDEESGDTKTKEKPMKKSLIANPIFMVALFALMGMLVFGKTAFLKEDTTMVAPNAPQVASQQNMKNDFQEATVTVSPSGYGPEKIELQAGKPAKINFKTEEGAGCLRQVVSKELGINTILSENEDNYVTINNLKPGTYQYTCGMGMFGGTITVK